MPGITPYGKAASGIVDFLKRFARDAVREPREKNGIVKSRVDGITGNQYVVEGHVIPSTGRVPIPLGSDVAVGYRKGKPVAILSHTARRAKFSDTPLILEGGILEELFFVTPNDIPEVWFRNSDQLSRILTGIPTGIQSRIYWGTPGDTDTAEPASDFFCIEDTVANVYRIYRLNRPEPNEPFPPGFDVEAELLQTYDLAADTTVFGTFSVSATDMAPASAGGDSKDILYTTQTVLVQNQTIEFPETLAGTVAITCISRFAGITPDGDLLVELFFSGSTLLTAGVLEWNTNPSPPPDNIATFASGFPIRLQPHGGSLLVNAKTGQVLLNHTGSISRDITGTNGTITAVVGSVSYTITPDASPNSPSGSIRLLSLRRSGEVYIPDRYIVLGPARVLIGDSGSLSAQANTIPAQVATLVTPSGQTLFFTAVDENVETVQSIVINGYNEVQDFGGKSSARVWVVFYPRPAYTFSGFLHAIYLYNTLTNALVQIGSGIEFPIPRVAKVFPVDQGVLVNFDDANQQEDPYFVDTLRPTDINLNSGEPPRDDSLDSFSEMFELGDDQATILAYVSRDAQIVRSAGFQGGAE